MRTKATACLVTSVLAASFSLTGCAMTPEEMNAFMTNLARVEQREMDRERGRNDFRREPPPPMERRHEPPPDRFGHNPPPPPPPPPERESWHHRHPQPWGGNPRHDEPDHFRGDRRERLAACMRASEGGRHWSHGWRVTGSFMGGNELNRLTRSNAYWNDHPYFVVHWDNGNISALRMGRSETRLPAFDVEYKDQQGHWWKLRRGWEDCR